MNKKLKYFLKKRKSDKRKTIFGSHAKGVIYISENGVIALPIADTTIGKELGFNGNWDIKEINTVINQTKPEDVIYVIGTHVGTLLVPLAKRVANVIGFEANENTFWFMQMNLCLNKIKNVILFQNAVGNENKTVKFYQNTVNTGGSKIKPIKDSILYNYDSPNEVEVPMIALDSFISSENLAPPNGIIMDIEGSEYYALQGMQHTLKDIRFLYVEYVPHHLQNVSNVTVEEFLKNITPHFSKATFLKNNTIFDLEKTSDQLISYVKNLESKNIADDILFTK
ncbi:MAG: FkbM family methyltransferase [Aureispira sp.]|jgi:FkbM family methyltransferase